MTWLALLPLSIKPKADVAPVFRKMAIAHRNQGNGRESRKLGWAARPSGSAPRSGMDRF